MNLGQTMIALGMLILLIMSVISANRMILENTEAQVQTEALEATAFIADSMFAEILSHPFDCAVVADTNSIYSSSHTPWKQETTGGILSSALSDTGGVHWGVKHMRRDPVSGVLGADLDDYDGYTTTVSRNGISGYVVTVAVYYVTATAPDTKVGSKQFLKKVRLTITNPTYLPTPVKYSALAAY